MAGFDSRTNILSNREINMTRYAHVDNNTILGIYDNLPRNWQNVSNFYLLSDDELFEYGFIKIVKAAISYDPDTEVISQPMYSCVGDKVIEHIVISPKPQEPRNLDQEWENLRAERDKRINDFEWRYMRSHREIRLGLKPTDSIESLDRYIQALADVTKIADPRDAAWPVYGA